jgi:hypothetical protein
MIKLERTRTKQAINAGLRGIKRKEKAVLLLTEFYANSFNFNSEHWKKAKPQLKRESFGKCAYCEAPTNTVAHGDVEHFRPKSVYWWLAYCYDNYSYSCQICNQSFKSDKFPISAARMNLAQHLPSIEPDETHKNILAPRLFPDPFDDSEGLPFADFKAACVQEKSFLLDPYLFNPEEVFAWEIDKILKEVKLIPRENTAEAKTIIKTAEDCLGLNREELCVLRWKTYEILETFKETLSETQLSVNLRNKTKAMLKTMTNSNAIFAGMTRYFVRDIWSLSLD